MTKCVLWLLWCVRALLIPRNRICLSTLRERRGLGSILGYAKVCDTSNRLKRGARAPRRIKCYLSVFLLCICFSRSCWNTNSSQGYAFSISVIQGETRFSSSSLCFQNPWKEFQWRWVEGSTQGAGGMVSIEDILGSHSNRYLSNNMSHLSSLKCKH